MLVFTIIIILVICVGIYYIFMREKSTQEPGIFTQEEQVEEGFFDNSSMPSSCTPTQISNTVRNTTGGRPSFVTLTGPSCVKVGEYFTVQANLDSGAGKGHWALNGVRNAGCLNPGCGFMAPKTAGIAIITYEFTNITGTLQIQVVENSPQSAPTPTQPIPTVCNPTQISNTVNNTTGSKPSFVTLTGPSCVNIGENFTVQANLDSGAGKAYWALNGVLNAGCLNPGCGFTAPKTPGIAIVTYVFTNITGILQIQVVDNKVVDNIIVSPKIDGDICQNLGSPSSDNKIRNYTKSECNTLGGTWSTNGECIKRSGGSYSWDCRCLNNPPPPTCPQPPPPAPVIPTAPVTCPNGSTDVSNSFQITQGVPAPLNIMWYTKGDIPKLIVQYKDTPKSFSEVPEGVLKTRRNTSLPVVKFDFFNDSKIQDANSVLAVEKINGITFGSFQGVPCAQFDTKNSYIKMLNSVSGSAFCSYTTKLYVSGFGGPYKQNRFFALRQGGASDDTTGNMKNSVAIEGGINGNDGSVTISLKCNTQTDDPKNILLVTSPRNMIKVNTWYHIGVVFTTCLTYCKLYINGTTVKENNNTRIAPGFYTDRIYDYASIGHGYSGWGDATAPMPFMGGMAWQHWFDYPLSDKDVIADMDTHTGITATTTVTSSMNTGNDDSVILPAPATIKPLSVHKCFIANLPSVIIPNPYNFNIPPPAPGPGPAPAPAPTPVTPAGPKVGNVHVVCEVGQCVWGTNTGWIGTAAPNTGIKWIWGTPDGATYAPLGRVFVFYGDFNNTGAAKTFLIAASADNFGRVFIADPAKGLDLGTALDVFGTPFLAFAGEKAVTLPTGVSRIFMLGENGGGSPNPAAVWLTVKDSSTNKVVFKTDQSWNFQGITGGNVLPIAELGTGPWGMDAQWVGGFFNQRVLNAGAPPFWIWTNTPATVGKWYSFTKTIENPVGSPVLVNIFGAIDNIGRIYINGIDITGAPINGFISTTYTIPAGTVNIEIRACNTKYANAGIWFYVQIPNSPSVLAVSAEDWTWSPSKAP